MKLYTEEQVIRAIIFAQKSSNIFSTPLMYDKDDIMDKITPIELPSDEEIEKQSPFKESTFGFEQGQYQGFILGAKWLKEQITKTK